MKSYVTMFTCPICKKENGTIGLDKRLKESFEMYTPSSEPCDKCRKKYLKTGILIINPENGDLVVLKTTAFKRIFDKPVPKGRVAFAESGVLERLLNKVGE